MLSILVPLPAAAETEEDKHIKIKIHFVTLPVAAEMEDDKDIKI